MKKLQDHYNDKNKRIMKRTGRKTSRKNKTGLKQEHK